MEVDAANRVSPNKFSLCRFKIIVCELFSLVKYRKIHQLNLFYRITSSDITVLQAPTLKEPQ